MWQGVVDQDFTYLGVNGSKMITWKNKNKNHLWHCKLKHAWLFFYSKKFKNKDNKKAQKVVDS